MIEFTSNILYHAISWAPLDPLFVMRGELGLGIWRDLGDYSVQPGDAKTTIYGTEIRLGAKYVKIWALHITGERKQA